MVSNGKTPSLPASGSAVQLVEPSALSGWRLAWAQCLRYATLQTLTLTCCEVIKVLMDCLAGKRFAQEKSLHFGATHLAHDRQLLFRLNAFCNNIHIEASRHGQDGVHDRAGTRIILEPADKCEVDPIGWTEIGVT